MNFKRIIMLASVAAAAATAQTALAADLPVQRAYTAPAVVAPVSNWTGFYVGGGIGYGLMDVESHTNGPGFAATTAICCRRCAICWTPGARSP